VSSQSLFASCSGSVGLFNGSHVTEQPDSIIAEKIANDSFFIRVTFVKIELINLKDNE
jgi:hypothetical protein